MRRPTGLTPAGAGVPALLAVLVVLAGCSAVTPLGPTLESSSAGPTTVTPAPVPSDTGEPDRQLAPGLNTSGVVDPERLERTHTFSVFFAPSYTIERFQVTRAENGTLMTRSRSVVRENSVTQEFKYEFVAVLGTPTGPLAPTGSASVAFFDSDDRAATQVRYRNGTRVVRPVEQADVPALRTTALDGVAEDLSGLFASAEFRVVGPHIEGGRPVYNLVSTAVPNPERLELLGGDHDPRDVVIIADVGADGRVYRYTLEYTTTTATGDVVQRFVSVDYLLVGETEVLEPLWFRNATRTVADAPRLGVAPGTGAERRTTLTSP